ncbi:MAG: hypothetical protein M1823_001274 [Watsoniomyces obsoletus]|nr:MAG: hypothetical protein M1823_001274 [Watsoniomyces obsoletus]
MTSVSSANGKTSAHPPTIVGGSLTSPPIAVGNNAHAVNGGATTANSTTSAAAVGAPAGLAEHARKTSVTISAAGATGYRPNGGPVVAAAAGRPAHIQFGTMSAASSPAASYSVPHQQPQQQHHASSSLSVGPSPNPRVITPQSSPSPIPQPAASGGRPPTGLHAPANAMNFGSLGAESDHPHVSVARNRRAGSIHAFRADVAMSKQRPMRASMPQGPLGPGPGPHANHLRRESSHSAHSDMSSSTGMPTGPSRGGYHGRGGRGGGYHNNSYTHQPSMSYSHGPGPAFRNVPNPPRGGPVMSSPYPAHQHPNAMRPFADQPHRPPRSPAPMAPGTPQSMPPMPMVGAQTPASYASYPPNMGPPQVNTAFLSAPWSSNSSVILHSASPSVSSSSPVGSSPASVIHHHHLHHSSPTPGAVAASLLHHHRSSPNPRAIPFVSYRHQQVMSSSPGSSFHHSPVPGPPRVVSRSGSDMQRSPSMMPVQQQQQDQMQPLIWTEPQVSYSMPPGYDPNYAHFPPPYGMYPGMPGMPAMYMNPAPNASPRPPPYAGMPAGVLPPGYGHDPMAHVHAQAHVPAPQGQSMSRTSSAISEQRPASSVGGHVPIGQVPTPSVTPAAMHAHPPSHGKTSPASNPDFKIPSRTKITLKDPNSGAVITDFNKQASSSGAPTRPASNGPTIVSSTPTLVSTTDASRGRAESKSGKTDEEKKHDMRDAIARKVEAEKAEERRRQEQAEREEEEERKERERQRERDEEEQRFAAEKEKAAEAEREAADEAKREQEAKERAEREAEAARQKAHADEKAKADAAEAQAKRDAEEHAHREADARQAEVQAKVDQEKSDAALARREAEAAKSVENETPTVPTTKDAGATGNVSKTVEVLETAATEAKKDETAAEATPPPTIKRPIDSGASTPATDDSMGPPPRPHTLRNREKPGPLNLAPIKTTAVEPPQPSAAMQALRSARFITQLDAVHYPTSVISPNPALNAASTKGRFKYQRDFLMQFQGVFSERPSVDWENRLKDSVGGGSGAGNSAGGGGGDSARPTSARAPASMGPRNTSGRPSLPTNFSMGTFGQQAGGGGGGGGGGGRTLPPGTTSHQRFEMSDPTRRPTMNNPLSQYVPRTGSFPMGGPAAPMQRTNSSTMLGNQNAVPQSPRQGNRSQRGNPKRTNTERGPTKREEEQAAKTMPLTAGMDLKPLLPSTTGWKPRSLAQSSAATGAAGPPPGAAAGTHMPPDLVQRKVKAALNKMTPEKFDKISEQILEIAAQSKDESDGRTLRQVIQLTFEKATDEAHWASMYAKFCRRMLDAVNPEIKDESITDRNGVVLTGGALFRKYLLNRCQEEFERGWKVNLPPKPEGETEEAVMLSDEYYVAAAAKRRGLGLIQFIGELYKLTMLTERIMHECVKKLVDYEGVPEEAEVESLTKLLRTIGGDLDQTERGKSFMNAYFQRINDMVDLPGLPSRLRFMLMDIIELRSKGWQSKERNKGPQTIQEIRENAIREQAEKEAERARQQSQRQGGRMPPGRGDARNYSGGGQYGGMPPPDHQRNTVGMDDLRKLGKGAISRSSTQQPMAFGPTSMFSSRSSSGRKPPLGGGSGANVRGGEESGHSSRTGTPPAANASAKESTTSANTFSLLAALDASGDANSASPPSATSSPPMTKSKLVTADDREKNITSPGSTTSSSTLKESSPPQKGHQPGDNKDEKEKEKEDESCEAETAAAAAAAGSS